MAYNIIKDSVVAKVEFKKSVFICYLYFVKSKDEVTSLITSLREEHKDARHHCWAFIIGDPEGSSLMGLSDDGEPHGTAGKPILNILQHNKMGDIVAIVVRYWGGTKLGTGGLVRAYSSAVQKALAKANVIEKIDITDIVFDVPFSLENTVRNAISSNLFTIKNVQYSNQVSFTVSIPIENKNEFEKSLVELSNGKISFSIEN